MNNRNKNIPYNEDNIREMFIMEEREFTLKSEFAFTVSSDIMDETSFKDAFEKGIIKIVRSNISVTEPKGRVLDDEITLKQIRDAIIFGLKEKA